MRTGIVPEHRKLSAKILNHCEISILGTQLKEFYMTFVFDKDEEKSNGKLWRRKIIKNSKIDI